MFTKVRNEKGFTLIELLIVVAIIGILAAIAIPQFAAYRIRGYNSAANSDIRNAKTAEEALFADRQGYGVSEVGLDLTALTTAGDGPGAPGIGPLPPATDTQPGVAIATFIDTNNDGAPDTTVGIGIGVSSNVVIKAGTAGAFGNAVITSEHRLSNRAYSTTTGGTAICYAENGAWQQLTNEVDVEATPPADPTLGCGAQPSGGSPVATWVSL